MGLGLRRRCGRVAIRGTRVCRLRLRRLRLVAAAVGCLRGAGRRLVLVAVLAPALGVVVAAFRVVRSNRAVENALFLVEEGILLFVTGSVT